MLRKINKNNEIIRNFLPSIIIIVLMLLVGNILTPGFTSANNVFNIICKASVLTIVCIGQAFVMISGNSGIDMSVGSIMSCAALLGPSMTQGQNIGLLWSLPIFLILGFLVGVINGLCIQKFRLPALVVTLCMGIVVDGLTIGFTHGKPSLKIPDLLLELGIPYFGRMRLLTIIVIVLLFLMELFLQKSKYGRQLFLCGSNQNVARLSGLRVNVIVVISYGISAMMAALAGFALVGYVGSAQLFMADEYTMLSVGSVFIGGTSLSGGNVGVIGVALGAFFLFQLTSILTVLGLPDGARIGIEGLVLLLILMANSRESKLRI